MKTENKQLDRKNAYCTTIVREVATGIEYPFKWRGERVGMLGARFYHVIIKDGAKERVLKSDFPKFEVVALAYEPLLSDLWSAAYIAFTGTSFSPYDRQEETIREHELQLQGDIANMPADDVTMYVACYKKYLLRWLTAKSRCTSTMITGSGNYNVSRHYKMNDREHSASVAFTEWREKALSTIERRAERLRRDSLSDSQRISEDFKPYALEIEETFAVKAPWKKALCYGRLERQALKGNVELMQRAIDLVNEMQERLGVLFTPRHKFWKLVDLATMTREKLTDRSASETEVEELDVCKVQRNFEVDRLQLLFDGKPSPSVIALLKRGGYRWSPRFSAWQRQLTNNATSTLPALLDSIRETHSKQSI